MRQVWQRRADRRPGDALGRVARGSRFLPNECRIIGGGVELVIWDAVRRDALERGCDTLVAEYLPTPKNGQVASFFMVFDAQLRRVIGAVLKVEPDSLGPRSRMDTVDGWDSPQHMILMLALEEEFDVSIPEQVAGSATSFSAMKDAMEKLTRSGAVR